MTLVLVLALVSQATDVEKVDRIMASVSYNYSNYPVLEAVWDCVATPQTCEGPSGLESASSKAFNLLASIKAEDESNSETVRLLYSMITGEDSTGNQVVGSNYTLFKLYQSIPNKDTALSFLVDVGTASSVDDTSDPLTASMYNVITSTVVMNNYTLSIMASIIEGNVTESDNLAAYNIEQVMSVSPGLSPGGADTLITDINNKDTPTQTDFSGVATSQILINIVDPSAYEFVFSLLNNGGFDPTQIETATAYLTMSSSISDSDMTTLADLICSTMQSTNNTITTLSGAVFWMMIPIN